VRARLCSAATYVASYRSAAAGAPLTLAIAVHNIPEGLAVAMAVLHGTGSRTHAIGWATLSGLAEPLGAALAYAFVNPTSSASSFGGMFAVSAGMMVYVCLTELLPAAYREHPSARLVAHAFLAGCAVMASSLVLEKFNNSDSPP
jgi:ZIP family zinc transporter